MRAHAISKRRSVSSTGILIDYFAYSAIIMRMSYPEGLTSPEIEIAEGGTMLDNKS